MSDKIMVQWSDLTERTAHLIPWWVGCQVADRGARIIYWRPVEDAVNELVNHDPDLETWLVAAGFDHILVELGRLGLQLFIAGRITNFGDGGISYELQITDGIAQSRNLDEVVTFLVDSTLAGLAAIAKKRGIDPPRTRIRSALVSPGQLADIATAHGAGRPLVLVSPRYRHRPRLAGLRESLPGDEIDIEAGWAAYAISPPATSQRGSIDTEFDFTGIDRPLDLETMLIDARIVLLLVAPTGHHAQAQRDHLQLSMALLNEHVDVTASVSGKDAGILWTAVTMNSAPRSQIR